MLVLIETAAGYSLFRVKKKGLEEADADGVRKVFSEKAGDISKLVTLEGFSKFLDTKAALSAATALVESKLDKGLKKFLKREVVDNAERAVEKLIVADKQLGVTIKSKLGVDVLYSQSALEIVRGIRASLSDLLHLEESDVQQMRLALSHTLNRFKLKFSPEKVDTMIVQAIGMLDDLDRELNNFAMRLKEWYGWHFPELGKIVTDNMLYAKAVQQVGFRTNSRNVDLAPLLTDDVAKEVAHAAEISMGTEITEEDLQHILQLAQRVIELTDYRATLAEYLKFRMSAVAPNLTCMVGELIGARLIAHAGSLLGLAKHPGSTVQILGAEKALFRALKTKKQTPKYGLIYHATLVGQTAPKFKGKISRSLAAKMALAIRVDALGDQAEPTVGLEGREYVERRVAQLTDGPAANQMAAQRGKGTAILKNPPLTTPKFTQAKQQRSSYGVEADVITITQQPVKGSTGGMPDGEDDDGPGDMPLLAASGATPSQQEKRQKKKRKQETDESVVKIVPEDAGDAAQPKKKKKKEKEKKRVK